MEVKVVKSNRTMKFSAGFTKFMTENNIVYGNRLMFRLIEDKTFLV